MIKDTFTVANMSGAFDILYDTITELIGESVTIPELVITFPISTSTGGKLAIKLTEDFRINFTPLKYLHFKIPRLGIDINLTGFAKLMFKWAVPAWALWEDLDFLDDTIEGSDQWPYYKDGTYGIGDTFATTQEITYRELITNIGVIIVGILLFVALIKLGQKIIASRFWTKLFKSSHDSDSLDDTANILSIVSSVNNLNSEVGSELSAVGKTLTGVVKLANTAMKLDEEDDSFQELEANQIDVLAAIADVNLDGENLSSQILNIDQDVADLVQLLDDNKIRPNWSGLPEA